MLDQCGQTFSNEGKATYRKLQIQLSRALTSPTQPGGSEKILGGAKYLSSFSQVL